MGQADRIAKNRARREAAEGLQTMRRDEAQRAASHLRLLNEVRALTRQALVSLRRDPERMKAIQSFKVSRSLRSLSGSRGGWFLGGVVGGLGHGETGEIALYLLTSGQFVYGGCPSTTSAVVTYDIDLFNDSQLTTISELLRDVI